MVVQSISDKELLEHMQANDEKAFALLFNRYWERLYTAAGKRLGNTPETKDIVQEIMASVWVKRHSLTTGTGESLEAYLFTLLRYRIFDAIAQHQRREISFHVFGQLLALYESHVLEDVISKELAAVIDHEIDAMPATMKKVMRLSQRQGYSVKEIAASLALSEKTVRNLSTTAMGRIRNCINRYYADAPATSSAQSAFVIFVLSLAGC